MTELFRTSARAVLEGLTKGELTPADLLDALEARIAAVDAPVNALPTLCFDRARERAGRAVDRGPLHGLPVAVKDLTAVAGVRTTWCSPIYENHVPQASDHLVDAIEAAGGVIYAKSNTPEFGAGASTFNDVFGRTANPHDLSRSVAGSSGGSAAALVSGTAWLATGSDLGGSLRNPASFCGCVGLRPSVGRVPNGPGADVWGTLAVDGPMARNVGDLGLFLDAMAVDDRREPLALPPGRFRAAAEMARTPARVAWSADLGLTPVEPEVARITRAAALRFESLGAVVEEVHPDLSGAHEAFQTLRAVGFAAAHADHLRDHRDRLKDDVVWNIEKGLRLTGDEVGRALRLRSRITGNLIRFLDRYDLLLTPATVVAPFPVEDRTVTRINGQPLDTYIDWLAIAYAITLTGAPALSLPCGHTTAGLPVGLQMVGHLRGEEALLSHAAALEAELGLDLSPIDPRAPQG